MAGDWINLGVANNLPDRSHLTVNGRRITVLRVARGGTLEFTAFDSLCFHAGGALGRGGAVSVIDGRTCVTCPLHKYVIDVFTGERIVRESDFPASIPSESTINYVTDNDETDIDDDARALERDFVKRFRQRTLRALPGVKQRIHDVRIENGRVMVRLRITNPSEAPSDVFAFSPSFAESQLDW